MVDHPCNPTNNIKSHMDDRRAWFLDLCHDQVQARRQTLWRPDWHCWRHPWSNLVQLDTLETFSLVEVQWQNHSFPISNTCQSFSELQSSRSVVLLSACLTASAMMAMGTTRRAGDWSPGRFGLKSFVECFCSCLDPWLWRFKKHCF